MEIKNDFFLFLSFCFQWILSLNDSVNGGDPLITYHPHIKLTAHIVLFYQR